MEALIFRSPEPERWQVPVVYLDEAMLALSKPAGLLTSPDRYNKQRPNLMAFLHDGIRTQTGWARRHGLIYLANVHRLDADTSGLLLLARTRKALNDLAGQFVQRQTKKVYLAIVHGAPSSPELTIDSRIGPHPTREGLFVVKKREGKEAITKVRLLETFHRYSLVEAEPLTGRTHQIRVHLKSIGIPIVCDPLYASSEGILLSHIKRGYRHSARHPERPLLGRLALHALRLTIKHPVTRQPTEIAAPIPRDFEVTLKYLRKFCG